MGHIASVVHVFPDASAPLSDFMAIPRTSWTKVLWFSALQCPHLPSTCHITGSAFPSHVCHTQLSSSVIIQLLRVKDKQMHIWYQLLLSDANKWSHWCHLAEQLGSDNTQRSPFWSCSAWLRLVGQRKVCGGWVSQKIIWSRGFWMLLLPGNALMGLKQTLLVLSWGGNPKFTAMARFLLRSTSDKC